MDWKIDRLIEALEDVALASRTSTHNRAALGETVALLAMVRDLQMELALRNAAGKWERANNARADPRSMVAEALLDAAFNDGFIAGRGRGECDAKRVAG